MTVKSLPQHPGAIRVHDLDSYGSTSLGGKVERFAGGPDGEATSQPGKFRFAA